MTWTHRKEIKLRKAAEAAAAISACHVPETR